MMLLVSKPYDDEWWIGKDLQWSSHGHDQGTNLHYWGTEENHEKDPE
jgi:hypothetical protein